MPALPDDQARVLRSLYDWRFAGRANDTSRSCLERVPDYILAAELDGSGIDVRATLDALCTRGLARRMEEPWDVGGEWTLHGGRLLCVKLRYENGRARCITEVYIQDPGQPRRVFRELDGYQPHGIIFELTPEGMVVAESDRAGQTGSKLRRELTVTTTGPAQPVEPAAAQYDIFICHASEDRATVVVPLVDELKKRRLRVWVDYNELRLGDKLRERIEEGLRCSRFAVVVVSPRFFGKPWPQSELDGLLASEMADRKKRILPIWHDVDDKVVAHYLPMLAVHLAVKWNDGLDKVAGEIIRAVM